MEKALRIQVRIIIVLIGSAVALGAFGAHGLRDVLTAEQHTSYATAVRYQMFMSLGAGFLVVLHALKPGLNYRLAVWMIFLGILLFCGSIYLLVFISEESALRSVLGPITPIGGLAMIAGWLWAFVRTSKSSQKV